MTEAENLISEGLRAITYTKGESKKGERNPHNRGEHNGSQKRK